MTCIVLELVDSTSKAFGFCRRRKKSQIADVEGKDEKYIYIYIYMCGIGGLWLRAFSSTKGTTVLPICQGDNLVDGRIDDLLKSGHRPV